MNKTKVERTLGKLYTFLTNRYKRTIPVEDITNAMYLISKEEEEIFETTGKIPESIMDLFHKYDINPKSCCETTQHLGEDF